MQDLLICELGIVEYRAGVELQERLRARVQAGELSGVLLLLEHPPVYTRGRRSIDAELPRGEAWYRAQGIDIVDTDRGGKLTYHGPGQLVGYPIMPITDVLDFVRTMEQTIIAALADVGISAHTRPGKDYTGVWVDDAKIASIGVHVQRGVTTHGFAINVENDLEPFSWVVACGLPDVAMTSVALQRATNDRGRDLREDVARRFCDFYDLRGVPTTLEALDGLFPDTLDTWLTATPPKP